MVMTFFKYYDFSPNTKDTMKKVKEEYPNYDVVVMNLMNNIFVELIHPDLLQEFLSNEKVQYYEKASYGRDTTSRALG